MVDKNLETDREVTIEYELEIEPANNFEVPRHEKELLDLIDQKRAADLAEKVGCAIRTNLPVPFFTRTFHFRYVLCAENSIRKMSCSRSSRSMLKDISLTTARHHLITMTSISSSFRTLSAIFK